MGCVIDGCINRCGSRFELSHRIRLFGTGAQKPLVRWLMMPHQTRLLHVYLHS